MIGNAQGTCEQSSARKGGGGRATPPCAERQGRRRTPRRGGDRGEIALGEKAQSYWRWRAAVVVEGSCGGGGQLWWWWAAGCEEQLAVGRAFGEGGRVSLEVLARSRLAAGVAVKCGCPSAAVKCGCRVRLSSAASAPAQARAVRAGCDELGETGRAVTGRPQDGLRLAGEKEILLPSNPLRAARCGEDRALERWSGRSAAPVARSGRSWPARTCDLCGRMVVWCCVVLCVAIGGGSVGPMGWGPWRLPSVL